MTQKQKLQEELLFILKYSYIRDNFGEIGWRELIKKVNIYNQNYPEENETRQLNKFIQRADPNNYITGLTTSEREQLSESLENEFRQIFKL